MKITVPDAGAAGYSDGMTRVETTESWRLTRPDGEAGAVVFASPHSGDVYPPDMAPAQGLTPHSLRSAEDAMMDRMAASGPRLGAPLLAGVVGRSYVDLNRAEDELDPLLTPAAPGARFTSPSVSPRAAAGYGVAARLSGDGRPLYDRRLEPAELERRLALYHRPYHRQLSALMHAAKARWGHAILIDWHSMPARGAGGARTVDVCLGDRHGRACPPALTRRLKSLFEAQGLSVALNHPYAGGHATAFWGRPAEGLHAVQIELSRGLYWNEDIGAPSPGWDGCVRRIAAVCADFAPEALALAATA